MKDRVSDTSPLTPPSTTTQRTSATRPIWYCCRQTRHGAKKIESPALLCADMTLLARGHSPSAPFALAMSAQRLFWCLLRFRIAPTTTVWMKDRVSDTSPLTPPSTTTDWSTPLNPKYPPCRPSKAVPRSCPSRVVAKRRDVGLEEWYCVLVRGSWKRPCCYREA